MPSRYPLGGRRKKRRRSSALELPELPDLPPSCSRAGRVAGAIARERLLPPPLHRDRTSRPLGHNDFISPRPSDDFDIYTKHLLSADLPTTALLHARRRSLARCRCLPPAACCHLRAALYLASLPATATAARGALGPLQSASGCPAARRPILLAPRAAAQTGHRSQAAAPPCRCAAETGCRGCRRAQAAARRLHLQSATDRSLPDARCESESGRRAQAAAVCPVPLVPHAAVPLAGRRSLGRPPAARSAA